MYIYVQITHTHVYYIMHMYEFLCIIGDSESQIVESITVGLHMSLFGKFVGLCYPI